MQAFTRLTGVAAPLQDPTPVPAGDGSTFAAVSQAGYLSQETCQQASRSGIVAAVVLPYFCML